MPDCAATSAAHWAVIDPDGVDVRQTTYDREAACTAYRATADPLWDEVVEMLAEPIKPEVVIAEERVFAG
jgi:hypothetical protein